MLAGLNTEKVYCVLCEDDEGVLVLSIYKDEQKASNMVKGLQTFAKENEQYWYQESDFVED